MSLKLLLCLFLGLSVSNGASISGSLEKRATRVTATRFYIASRANIQYRQLDVSSAAAIESSGIPDNARIAVLIHGRDDSAYGDFAITVYRELILAEEADFVVIVVDWSFVASLDYSTARTAVPAVGYDVASVIQALAAHTTSKVDLTQLHIIGFDLGAHVAGVASRAVGARQITGLSPAGENWGINTQRLTANDAAYVEVIHTDVTGSRAIGITEPIGRTNIYPNGVPSRQPGCSNNDCNHQRAWRLFAATVSTGGHLWATACENYAQMTSNRCALTPLLKIGTNDINKIAFYTVYRLTTGNTNPF